ncbi:hypothetical protein T35B1_18603 [Salinisphaera shabanensis T35B1]|uniref:hypothetical protein n=1 Tax=Salinisphaera shabanensis TaxID=180542 RepID=UPI0033425134
MDQDEHDRLNAELRRGWSEQRAKKRKEKVRDIFLAMLVLVGLFAVGGFIYAVLPEPWNILCMVVLVVFWLYCFEN